MKNWKTACLLALVFLPLLSGADDSLLEGMQSIRDVQHFRLDSGIVERPYHLLIKLPPDAGECPSCRYPTVFLLDGGAIFPSLAGYASYLWYEKSLPPFILVGISYGGDTHEEGNYRSTDYTAPSQEREYWGGADAFQRVISEEIMPHVEGLYPVDSERRIIFGQSLAGQFVLFTALSRPELFYGHISSNPALHRNLDYFLQSRGAQGHTRLFVAVGSNDSPAFKPFSEQWLVHWTDNDQAPFELESRILQGYGHFSILPESFRQGLIWLIGEA